MVEAVSVADPVGLSRPLGGISAFRRQRQKESSVLAEALATDVDAERQVPEWTQELRALNITPSG